MKRILLAFVLTVVASTAWAEDYYRSKWFEFPDPLTKPKVTATCVKKAKYNVPCPTWKKPGRMCPREDCVGHAYKTELLRKEVIFVVSGPPSHSEAVKRIVIGYATGCAYKAVTAGKTAGAAAPSPEPAARIAAALGTTIATFKACLAAFSGATVAAGIINSLSIKIETPSHWARI